LSPHQSGGIWHLCWIILLTANLAYATSMFGNMRDNFMATPEDYLNHLFSLRPAKGPLQADNCLALGRSFLELETLWLDALGMPATLFPCVDLAGALGQSSLPDDIEKKFRESRFAQSSAESRACHSYLRWCLLKESRPETIQAFGIDDPYVPMIMLFESGGEFSLEGWFFDILKCGGINVRALRQRVRSRYPRREND